MSQRVKLLIPSLSLVFLVLGLAFPCFAQGNNDVEFSLDANSETIPLPKIFKPNIDLSGRGFNRSQAWPQGMAAQAVLDTWGKDIGFGGIYRLQYNLWEIKELEKDKAIYDKLLANYEDIIKRINDSSGIVILDIYGMPAGLGKVLDRKSAPVDLRLFKELVKSRIRYLSCIKKYNIWYEVWSAPDLDEFFLGRKQEYLAMYKEVAQAIHELEEETKINIPLGGPSTSWWFQASEGNSAFAPEKSMIYELIKYCHRYRLPLDFISWHAYTTDPQAERELTKYNKTPVALVRDWLSYFNFDREMPLIIDEWNYDDAANISPEKAEHANICASFIPARLKNMYEAGLNYQLFYCLEDFHDNKENVTRNVGIFWYDAQNPEYKGEAKCVYNAFKMLNMLGREMFIAAKLNDEYIGAIATKQDDTITILAYNYIDPEAARSYLSRNIASLNEAQRKSLLKLIKADSLDKIISRRQDISSLHLGARINDVLSRAQGLNDQANSLKNASRNLSLNIKNLKGKYLYQRYEIDSSCVLGCGFAPVEEKEIDVTDSYQQTLALSAYSVELLVFKKKPAENPALPAAAAGKTDLQR